MIHLAMAEFGGPDAVFSNYGLWAFLSVGAVALFGVFIPLVTWMDSRRKEREAYYKAETLRRVTEASGEGAKAAVQLLQEEDRLKRVKILEGLKIGGVINVGVGIALVIFLLRLVGPEVAMCGLIPGLIGAAMLVYVYLLAAPVR
jgi:hypothetical protein